MIARRYLILVMAVLGLIACQEQRLTTDTSARLSFSSDTVCFDTVFTAAGSSTRQIIVYNHNANALRISRVWWSKGECFFANLDGENKTELWQDITLNGGDSLFLFLRTEIDPYGTNAHPIEVDTLHFEVNGHIQHLPVQAYGLDVERLITDTIYDQGLTLTAERPYLIYDTLWVAGTLTIQEGATLYMHQNANIVIYGNLAAAGTAEHPIRILGDRTDLLFPQVPYRVASGQWGGIYLFCIDSIMNGLPVTHHITHTEILSGQVGVFSYADNPDHSPSLYIHNTRVHNMSADGIVAENTNAYITNTEISNCAAYGLYLCGGTHIVEQTSIANFFGYPYTTLNIHNVSRENVAAVYILAHSADMADSHSTLRNCIITGAVTPAIVVDSIPETGYQGQVRGCYLSSDTLPAEWAGRNTYAQAKDSLFRNTYYKYGEYIYYDFRLVEHAVARGIGLPLDSLMFRDLVNKDINNTERDPQTPDAGCYQYSN